MTHSLKNGSLAVWLLLSVCGCWKSGGGGAGDDTASDADVDGDTDADGDGDTDADGDADTDADSDGDTDTDGDADTDADSDSDTDSETDSEAPCVRRVDIDVGTPGDGLSWATAFASIQEAVDAAYFASLAEGACQVWVAEGSYDIFEGSAEDTLHMMPQVPVYSGFAGTEETLEERDWDAHETVLDGGGLVNHVVTVATVMGDDWTRLDGFVVTGGDTLDGSEPESSGAGLLMDSWGHLTVAHCRFEDNSSGFDGGAIRNDGALVVEGCAFTGNTAGMDGGAITNSWTLLVRDSVFTGNTSGHTGGAISDGAATEATIESCVFRDNSAADYGGAIAAFNSDPLIVNCTFTGNEAVGGQGGAVFGDMGGITIVGSVCWGDSPDEVSMEDADVAVSYSLVQGGFEGVGNIDGDPLFADPDGGDFRLQAGSPCIDAADGTLAPEFDLDGNARIDDPDAPDTGLGPPWADMGAYERMP